MIATKMWRQVVVLHNLQRFKDLKTEIAVEIELQVQEEHVVT